MGYLKNAKYQGSDGFSLVSIILKSTPKLKEDELILTNMFNLVGSTTAKKMLAANFYSDVLFLPTCSVWFGNMIPIDIVSDYFSFFSRHRVREMSDLDFLRILPSDSSPSFTIAFGIHRYTIFLGHLEIQAFFPIANPSLWILEVDSSG